jgi:hypothetical protein
MDDVIIGTHVLPLSARDSEAKVVRLGDIFDGGNKKCRKIVKLAPEAEKKGLKIIRRKRPLLEMGVRGPSPTTTQRLKNQGIVVENTEIEDLTVKRAKTRLEGENAGKTMGSVGENFAVLPGNSSRVAPTIETINNTIVEVVIETIDDVISNASTAKSTSAYTAANASAYTTAYMSANATANTTVYATANASAYTTVNVSVYTAAYMSAYATAYATAYASANVTANADVEKYFTVYSCGHTAPQSWRTAVDSYGKVCENEMEGREVCSKKRPTTDCMLLTQNECKTSLDRGFP